MNKTGNFYG